LLWGPYFVDYGENWEEIKNMVEDGFFYKFRGHNKFLSEI
jgi:hypothetical protein